MRQQAARGFLDGSALADAGVGCYEVVRSNTLSYKKGCLKRTLGDEACGEV